jgi:hypothetical protein
MLSGTCTIIEDILKEQTTLIYDRKDQIYIERTRSRDP